MSAQQLLFHFLGDTGFSAESTLPLPEQALVHTAFSQLQYGSGLVIEGGEGVGKTHLLHLLAHTAEENIVSATKLHTLTAPFPKVLLVNDVHKISSDDAEILFHAFNELKETKGILVLTTAIPLQFLDILPDLKTRLLTLPSVKIDALEESSLNMLLLKWAADCQLKFEKPVFDYILKRADRSPVRLRNLIEKLNKLSLEEKRAVTIPLARQVLSQQH